MDYIAEIVINILFYYPGGFLRYLFSRIYFSKKPFLYFFSQEADREVNVIVGVITTVVLIVVLLAI